MGGLPACFSRYLGCTPGTPSWEARNTVLHLCPLLPLQAVPSSSAVKEVVGTQVHLPWLSHMAGLRTISKGYHHKSVRAWREQGNNSIPAAAPGAGEVRMAMIIILFLWQLHGTDPWLWLIAFPGNAWSSLGGSVLFWSLILLDISQLRQRQTRIHFLGCFRMTKRQTGLKQMKNMTWGGREEKGRKKIIVNYYWLGILALLHSTDIAFCLVSPKTM